MWTTPLYRYKVGGRQVTIDVTLSAPAFHTPAPIVPELIEELARRNLTHVLDFGAGSLRNTIPFLESGFHVYVAEYSEQFQRRPAAARMLSRAQTYENFGGLILPHQFTRTQLKFDAILFLYVANCIPVPRERALMMRYCRERMRPGGLLAWTTPGFDPHLRMLVGKKNKLNDGWILRLSQSRQVFHTEFSVPQIETLMEQSGFELEKRIEFGRHPCRLYRRS